MLDYSCELLFTNRERYLVNIWLIQLLSIPILSKVFMKLCYVWSIEAYGPIRPLEIHHLFWQNNVRLNLLFLRE